MAKTRRGKVLWKLTNHGRGKCPLCERTGVKLLWQRTGADGTSLDVCKRCRAMKSR